MRILAALAFTALSLPALSQDTVTDQVGAAYKLFHQGIDNAGMLDGTYYDTVVEGIGGTWVFASALLSEIGDPEKFASTVERACTGPGHLTLAASDPFTLTMTREAPDKSYAITFVYAGGTRFASQVDPEAILGYLGLLEEERRQIALTGLNSATGSVMIFRPSTDVLAIVRATGMTDLYARCAGMEDVVDLAALDALIGSAFDDEFPKVKNRAARDAFIACGREVLMRMVPADLQIAIETRLRPTSEDQARFTQLYPNMGEDAKACMDTAKATMN